MESCIVLSDKMPTREELQAAISEYDQAIYNEKIPEREVDDALLRIDALAPHSYITDLLNSGEKERTDQEAIDEALLREQLWREGGDVALYSHMQAQLVSALGDRSLNARRKHYCENMLEHIREKLGGVAH